jgi:hypothetical protein
MPVFYQSHQASGPITKPVSSFAWFERIPHFSESRRFNNEMSKHDGKRYAQQSFDNQLHCSHNK